MPIYIVYLRHTKATFNWGNRQHPNTKGKKMQTTKELKDQLWEVWYKAREAGASRTATNAILDAMVVIDKEAENSEKTEVCS